MMRSGRSGFTLLEVLVCMALAAMILLGCVSLCGDAAESYGRIEAGMGMDREARAVVRQLMEDLSSATDLRECMFEESAEAWPADRIGFHLLQAESGQPAGGFAGDLCAVRYELREVAHGGRTERCLVRSLHDSVRTFGALAEGRGDDLWRMDDADAEPLAFGVLAFELTRMCRDGEGRWRRWSEEDSAGPQALECRLVIANRQLAARLAAAGNGARTLGDYEVAGSHPDMNVYCSILAVGGQGDD